MSDLIDRAQEESDLHLNVALNNREPSLPVTGHCHWCGEIAPVDSRFCDSDCRDDWQQHKRFKG